MKASTVPVRFTVQGVLARQCITTVTMLQDESQPKIMHVTFNHMVTWNDTSIIQQGK